jgi:hypothetical protein
MTYRFAHFKGCDAILFPLAAALSTACQIQLPAPPGGSSSSSSPSGPGVGQTAGSGSTYANASGDDGGTVGTVPAAGPVDKVDLLFMIDNSALMGDKQKLLAQAVPDLIARLVAPNCVDANGNVTGSSAPDGSCIAGNAEFSPVHDMHIGIVTSSLGGRGGNQCDPATANPTNPYLSAHKDDRGELINRGGANETPVANAGYLNFLSWLPPIAANIGHLQPPTPAETSVGAPGQPGTLIGDFVNMLAGVNEHGCGFEAQNEAWYRFLIQPDPFNSIVTQQNGTQAALVGIDSTILKQRANFLRPDSLLAVIVLTDENEEVVNPVSVGGQGFLFEDFPWPSSPSGGGAPEGTIECLQSGPNNPLCTSCGFSSMFSASTFALQCPNDGAAGVQGYLDPSDDQVNVRFFDQKQRFGVFTEYPISRYVRGLQSQTVPDGAHEIDGNGNYVGDQGQFANCVNPLFAMNLPTDASNPQALCNLQPGPRTPDRVFYAAIAGMPHQLLQATPGDSVCPAGTNPLDCPQKASLTQADWTRLTGADPANYDFTGIDYHMLESIVPRTAGNPYKGEGTTANVATCGANAGDNCDPINGREWNTNGSELQFACTFHLEDPATGAELAKDCTNPAFTGACDCEVGSDTASTQLCAQSGGAYTTNQIYAKAYPSIREIAIARAMATSPTGDQGIVSSVCPIHTHNVGGGGNDPLYGYRPAVNALVEHMKPVLAGK